MMVDILNIDCMEYMRGVPDKHFDLAIVDPPYGINAPNMQMGHAPKRKDSAGYPSVSTAVKLKSFHGREKLKNRILNTMDTTWDLIPPGREYFDELFRVSKNQIIWGGNYFDLPPTRCIICWDKLQPWENFSQWEMAWTSFSEPAKIFRYSNTGGANATPKIHPTEKPIALYKWLLKEFAAPEQKIIDTHGGSCNSALAAHDFGINEFIACEINEAFYKTANYRLTLHKAQQKLF